MFGGREEWWPAVVTEDKIKKIQQRWTEYVATLSMLQQLIENAALDDIITFLQNICKITLVKPFQDNSTGFLKNNIIGFNSELGKPA